MNWNERVAQLANEYIADVSPIARPNDEAAVLTLLILAEIRDALREIDVKVVS
jgi:hypothetical protein